MFKLDQTLYEVFKEVAKKRKKAVAIFYKGNSISYQSLLKMTNRMACCLTKMGLAKGDTVTVLTPNVPEGVAALYACSQLGLKTSILHPLSKEERIKLDMEEKGSKALIIASLFLKDCPAILQSGAKILCLEIKGSLPPLTKALYPLAYKEDDFDFKAHPHVVRFLKQKEEDRSYVRYEVKEGRTFLCSGGTSGKEKSIALSDYAILSLLSTGPEILGISEEEAHSLTMLNALPTFHGFGLAMGVLVMLAFGGRVNLLPKFRTKEVIKALKQGRCDYMIGVPVMYEALLRNEKFNGKKLRNLRIAFVGGDFISPALLKRFNARLKENGSSGVLYEGYGLTETVTVLSVNTPSFHKEGSIGKPLRIVKAKIIDEDGNVLPPNAQGEIVIAGESLMNGYLEGEDPFIEIEGERYVKSGDLGKMDEEGYLYFTCRKKRTIKKKGFNVYPLQIEKRLSELPFVLECAYLGKEGEKEEETHLFLHFQDGADQEVCLKEIKALFEREFFPYEMPEHFHLLGAFPQTKVAKIDYNALLETIK